MSIALYRCVRAAGVLVVALSLAGCDLAVDGHGGFDFGLAAGKATDEWTRSYKLAPGGRAGNHQRQRPILAEASDGVERGNQRRAVGEGRDRRGGQGTARAKSRCAKRWATSRVARRGPRAAHERAVGP